jgi:Tol biopolymer transport system component
VTVAGAPWQIVGDRVIAAPYYWVVDGERVDRTPQLSPDGGRVAYLPRLDSRDTDLTQILVLDLASGAERDLTPEPGRVYTSVRWSADGRSLAFVKYGGAASEPLPTEIWRIDADGATLQLLYRDGSPLPGMRGPSLMLTRWSADGRYVEAQPTIWSGGGGSTRVRTDGSGAEEIAYPLATDFGAGEGALVGGALLPPQGDYVLHVVETAGLIHKPQDAPESGHSLVLHGSRGQASHVLGSFAGFVYLPHSGISPDGQWIAFFVVPTSGSSPEGLARLWVVRSDGSGLREVSFGPSQPLRVEGLIWANGGRAYFHALPSGTVREVDGQLFELEAVSGTARPIATAWKMRDLVSVSLDGRRVLVMRWGGNEAELRLLELAPLSAGGAVTPALSVTPSGAPAAAALQFGSPRTLLEVPPWTGPDYRISPDGQWASYSELTTWASNGTVQHGALVARNTETGQMVTLVEGREVHRHAWLPDGSGVLAITGPGSRGEILMKTLGPEPAVSLVRTPAGTHGFEDLAVSPDETRIAFTVMHDASPAPVPAIGIEVMNVTGGNRREIVEPEYFIGDLLWSPDGREVVYFKGKGGTPPDDGESYVVDANGGSAPIQLLPRARLLDWSHDGRKALWESFPMSPQGHVDLYVTGWPELGVPDLLAGDANGFGATWVGDADLVAYVQAGVIYLVGTTGGEPRRLTPEGEWSEAPLWLPGRGLAYRAGTGAPGSIRLLPIR